MSDYQQRNLKFDCSLLTALQCAALLVLDYGAKIVSLTTIARLGSWPSVTVLRLIAYSDCRIARFIACDGMRVSCLLCSRFAHVVLLYIQRFLCTDYSKAESLQEAQLTLRNRASAMHFFVAKLHSIAVMTYVYVYHLRNVRPMIRLICYAHSE